MTKEMTSKEVLKMVKPGTILAVENTYRNKGVKDALFMFDGKLPSRGICRNHAMEVGYGDFGGADRTPYRIATQEEIEDYLRFTERFLLLRMEDHQGPSLEDIRHTLAAKFRALGINPPSNIEEIANYCLEDVRETADKAEWNDDDVAIALRRWIENQKS